MSPNSILASNASPQPVRATLWSALGVVSLGLFSSAVCANEAPEQVVVQYADLDLSSEQDAKRLYTRLQRASQFVCREFEGREPVKARLRQKCLDEALAGAVASVDHAVVTAMHADKKVRLAQGKTASQPRS
jgi:UrcA family protein